MDSIPVMPAIHDHSIQNIQFITVLRRATYVERKIRSPQSALGIADADDWLPAPYKFGIGRSPTVTVTRYKIISRFTRKCVESSSPRTVRTALHQ